MPATRLTMRRVAKPWGRRMLWPGFDDVPAGGEPVGEIWFEPPPGEEHELLVKYLFTSERLSIQVHPGDAAARASGYASGKDEAWVILDAEPDSTIALGLTRPVSREALRAAALDGSIERLVDWKPVHAGQAIYSPAGTVHAIGAGLTLIEVQQNVDLTYRLYDYGRPRELHLDAGIAVSNSEPFEGTSPESEIGEGSGIVAEGSKLVIERWRGAAARGVERDRGWFIPVAGEGRIEGRPWRAGECWTVEPEARISLGEGGDALFAYTASH